MSISNMDQKVQKVFFIIWKLENILKSLKLEALVDTI